MNLRKKFNSGFTLIELLVVVAIIGVLASVVLASLNTARAKGANASIKANLSNVRAQAEIVYDSLSPNGYGTASNASSCTSPTASSIFATTTPNTTVVFNAVAAAITSSGGTSFCGSTTSDWVASVQLKVAEGSGGTLTHWCVDSTGFSGGKTAIASGTAC